MEFKEAKQAIRGFMRDHYNDERLAMLLAHAQTGRLVYHSCCCFAGVMDAQHSLRGHVGRQFSEHISGLGDRPKAEASTAFACLASPRFNCTSICEHCDAKRRRILIPMIKAEMKRRAFALKAQEEKYCEIAAKRLSQEVLQV